VGLVGMGGGAGKGGVCLLMERGRRRRQGRRLGSFEHRREWNDADGVEWDRVGMDGLHIAR
jgi:hypothetical protein